MQHSSALRELICSCAEASVKVDTVERKHSAVCQSQDAKRNKGCHIETAHALFRRIRLFTEFLVALGTSVRAELVVNLCTDITTEDGGNNRGTRRKIKSLEHAQQIN